VYALSIVFTLLVLPASSDVADDVEDSVITARIETMFLLNQHLNPFNINTTTEQGVVTITGSVNDAIQKELAEELALSAKGVQSVNNEITVVPTAYGEKQRRSWRQKVEDKTVSASVRSVLLYHRHFKGLRIGVATVNNVVTLHGVVSSEEKKARIGAVAADVRGVHRVINNLTVRPKDPADPIQNIGRQLSDEWLEARVDTAIVLNRHLSGREIKVEVDDGICILTGTVDTAQEQALAEAVADSIHGVDRVQNDIRVREAVVLLEGIDPVEEPLDAPCEGTPKLEEEPLPAP